MTIFQLDDYPWRLNFQASRKTNHTKSEQKISNFIQRILRES